MPLRVAAKLTLRSGWYGPTRCERPYLAVGGGEPTCGIPALRVSARPPKNTTELLTTTELLYILPVMNASELKRWLKKQGCTFETHKGGSGHLTIKLGNHTSQLPMHGSKKELGRRLVNKIKKDLGL